MGEIGDRLHDRPTTGLHPDVGHEALVDLHDVDGIPPQVAQRGVPGPEVVQRQLDPDLLEVRQDDHRAFAVVEEDALRHLQRQVLRLRPRPFQGTGHARGEAGRHELPGRHVDRQTERLVGMLTQPPRPVQQSAVQDPLADALDERAPLGESDRGEHGHRPATGMVPAQQGLHAHDQPVGDADDRLVHQREATGVERLTKVILQLDEVRRTGRLPHVDDLVGGAALALDLIHRDIGVVHETGPDLVGMAGEGDTDARGDLDLHRPVLRKDRDREGLGERLTDAGCDRLDSLHGRQVLAQDDELVPGDPRERVPRAQQRAQAPRHGDQQRVTDRVPVGVVDVLEAVEVREQHRGLRVRTLGPFAGVLQPLLQQHPVGKPGQGVVQAVREEEVRGPAAVLATLGVDQVGRRDVGEGLRRRHVPVRERPRGVTEEVQGTEPTVVVTQREGEHRRHPHVGREGSELGEATVAIDVRHGDRLPRLVRQHAGALPERGLQLLQLQRGIVGGGNVVRVGGVVHERDPGGGDRQHLDDALDQVVQDAVDREVGEHGAGELGQHGGQPLVAIHPGRPNTRGIR